MEIIITILCLIIAGLIYAVYNALRKLEAQEAYSTELGSFIVAMHTRIVEDYKRLKDVDRRGAFEADDEVGYTFQTIKSIIDDLTKIIKEEKDAEKEETGIS